MPRPRKREETVKYTPKTKEELFRESLYGELTTPDAVEEETKREKEAESKKGKFLGHENFYFWLYDFTQKHFIKKEKEGYQDPSLKEDKRKKKKKPFPKSYSTAFDFLGWKLDHDVVMKMPFAAGVIALFLGIFISALIYMPLSITPAAAHVCGDGICEEMYGESIQACPEDCDKDFPVTSAEASGGISPIILLAILFIPIFLALGLVAYVQKYPIGAADAEKMRALTYVPEIMNYMVMQMRLQPNLERAVDFAAEHGEGRIAKEFRELLWKNSVGIYSSIEEALDAMAYRWEPYSEEFKHAITMMRASVLVPNDIQRGLLYDKVIEDILTSTKEKMELYAQSMKQPSMYLFYIAVLMPLMIIIMLPVAAAFAGIPVATTPVLAALYIFILPTITLVYANTVLAKRPGGYVPPKIPENHPDLPPKGTLKFGALKLPVVPIAVLMLIVILGVGMFIESSIKFTDAEIDRQMGLTGKKEIDQPSIIQYLISIAIAFPLSFYLFGISYNKRSVQDKILKMELDFKDAMYLLASRLGEKKPLEDAISYVKKFMPDSKVASELLEDVQRNIMVLGLTLRTAVFDPTYGAIKNIPSRLMNSAFKIMTDSIELGPEVASNSLISVSNQIRNVQKINDLMKSLLNDVTGMMDSMARFVSPVVLGIVASLQQVIIDVIKPLADSEGSGTSMGGISAGALEGMASPIEFQTIVAFYVIELVIILAYFSGKIQYGDNKTAIMLNIAKTLPISIVVFVTSLFMGGGLTGGLVG